MNKFSLPVWLAVACIACAAEVGTAPQDPVEGQNEALSNSYVTTYSSFAFSAGLHDSRDITLGIDIDPGRGAARFFAHQFSFQGSGGYIGLQTDGARPDGSSGKIAVFSIWNATSATTGDAGSWKTAFGGEGVGWSVRAPYDWQAGRSYQLRVVQLASGSWGGYVKDVTSGTQVYLGAIQVAANIGRLQGTSTTFTEYYGPDFKACSDLRLSRVSWSKPIAQPGSQAASLAGNSVGGGACATTRSSTGSGPTFHALGWAQVLYVGDSLAAETTDTLSAAIEATGKATLTASAFPGMALCDFIEGNPAGKEAAMPLDARLRAKVRSVKPNVVALQFWGNSLTPCIKEQGFGSENYYKQYFWNAFSAAQQVALGAQDAGIARPKLIWVLQGPEYTASPLPSGTQSRPQRLNNIYTYVAGSYADLTTDAGHDVSLAANYNGLASDRYTWTEFLPCTTAERNSFGLCTQPLSYGGVTRLHSSSDHVHFCLGDESTWDKFFSCGKTTLSPGIVRYGTRIAIDAKAALGL